MSPARKLSVCLPKLLLSCAASAAEVMERIKISRSPVSVQIAHDGSRCFVLSLWARQLTVENAPYECPPIAKRLRSATPSATILSAAACASATSCSTYVSLGSFPFLPMIGIVGLSSTPYP